MENLSGEDGRVSGRFSCRGPDDGAPGERRRYGVGYYGAYLRDPDKNKVHIVYRGDVRPDVVRFGDKWEAVS